MPCSGQSPATRSYTKSTLFFVGFCVSVISAGSSNGRTTDFESVYLGSNPSPAVNQRVVASVRRVVYHARMDNSIGEHLLEARITTGMSQGDLAIRLGVSVETISRWENGHRTPRAADLVGLSRILGKTVDALLGLDPSFSPRKRSKVERLRMVTK